MLKLIPEQVLNKVLAENLSAFSVSPKTSKASNEFRCLNLTSTKTGITMLVGPCHIIALIPCQREDCNISENTELLNSQCYSLFLYNGQSPKAPDC